MSTNVDIHSNRFSMRHAISKEDKHKCGTCPKICIKALEKGGRKSSPEPTIIYVDNRNAKGVANIERYRNPQSTRLRFSMKDVISKEDNH